jgi:hypothetical protein
MAQIGNTSAETARECVKDMLTFCEIYVISSEMTALGIRFDKTRLSNEDLTTLNANTVLKVPFTQKGVLIGKFDYDLVSNLGGLFGSTPTFANVQDLTCNIAPEWFREKYSEQ